VSINASKETSGKLCSDRLGETAVSDFVGDKYLTDACLRSSGASDARPKAPAKADAARACVGELAMWLS
jgi:hypothetical protein